VGLVGWLFKSPRRSEKHVHYVYVRCNVCDEAIKARIHLVNDPSADYSKRKASYHLRKTLIGSDRCFRPIEIELTFNERRRLVDQTIEGGEFISQREFDATSEEQSS
jgi:hypothetical protein